MKFSLLPLGVSVLLSGLGVSMLRAAPNVDYFSDNGYGNPVSTLQHPAAEHFNGVTYVAYSGPHEDPYVAAYVHGSARFRPALIPWGSHRIRSTRASSIIMVGRR
jgi:hypothetical protein